MNTKLRNSIIVLIILAIVIAVPLIVLSFGRIDVGYVALSYDNIIANYSSPVVYGPGMHFIGVARSFIRIKQISTLVDLNIQTYTRDYFKLNSKMIAGYQLTSPQDFNTVDNFYINFGPDAQQIIQSIMYKHIVSIISLYSSTQIQSTTNFTQTIQSRLQSQLTLLFLNQLDVSLKITVLIESLVIDGISSTSQQLVSNQIQHMLRQLQRAQNQKIQISSFIEQTKAKTLKQMQIVYQVIKQRTDLLFNLLEKYGNNTSIIGKILQGNQVTKNNLGYASSQLKLRPQLYLFNSSVVF